MTDSNPRPAVDAASFLRDYDAYVTRAAELHALNKARLFEALSAAGLTRVVVTFDGYGDSGQMESVEAFAGDDVRALPATPVEIRRLEFRADEPTTAVEPLPDAVETLAYSLLEEKHGGWENNAGGFGDFVFDVAAGEITLDFNERIEDSNNHTYVF